MSPPSAIAPSMCSIPPIRASTPAATNEITGGGPCVVCGLHLGNWELVAYAGKRMGAPFTGVFQRISNPYVDAETYKMRAFLYEGGLLPRPRSRRAGSSRRPRPAAIRLFSPISATTAAPRCRSSAIRRARTSSPPCSPARPDCRSTPAPPFACRTCVSDPGGPHPDLRDRRPRGRRGRGDGGAAGPVRGLHPRGARAMDVGPSQVGLGRRTGVAVDRKGRRLASPQGVVPRGVAASIGLACGARDVDHMATGRTVRGEKPCRSRRPRAWG